MGLEARKPELNFQLCHFWATFVTYSILHKSVHLTLNFTTWMRMYWAAHLTQCLALSIRSRNELPSLRSPPCSDLIICVVTEHVLKGSAELYKEQKVSGLLLPWLILISDHWVSNFRPQTTLRPINRVTTREWQQRSLGPGRAYKTLPMTFFRRHLFQPASTVTPDQAPRPVREMWQRGGECPASGTRLCPADRFLSFFF